MSTVRDRSSSSAPPDEPSGGAASGATPVAPAWESLVAPSRCAAAWRALVRVARRVECTYPPIAAGVMEAAELEPHLLRLCRGVAAVLDGDPPIVADSQALLPLRPVVDALRRGCLEEARAAQSSGALDSDAITVLLALEEVLAALVDDSAQRFAERLAEGDAMHLVVEVAHDMRSPLSSILFLAERLRRGQSGAISPVQERQLGLIYSAAFGLGSLASDVMELARGGDRLVTRNAVPFSVHEILSAVRDIVQPIAEEKGLGLRLISLELDSRVGYPQALHRVLLNLITNALKFTNEGNVTVTPRPVSRRRVQFVVEDTGRGIPPHVMATLFDAFRRRQRPGDYAFSSAGLGLSICRKLIAAMGGELQVDSQLEVGTRFSFEIDLPPVQRL